MSREYAPLYLLDSREAAAVLGVNVKTINLYARQGRLRGQLIGLGWKFDPQEVEDFAKGRTGKKPRKGRPYTPPEDPAEQYPEMDGFFGIYKPPR